jgi:uncharacterized protein YaiE (UPF0345 family)
MALVVALFSCEDEKKEVPGGTFEVNSPGSIFFEKTGGEGEVAVTVTGTLIYVPMSSDSTWCKITEKTETGFRFSVGANSRNEERTAELVVAAAGFPFVRIEVVQAAGDPKFFIATAEQSKSFSQAGGEVAVVIDGNIPYEVASSAEWCTYKNVTPSGFTLVADANLDIAQRTTSVTLTPAAGFGFSTVTINVRQSGNAVLQNGWFIDGMDHWETSGTSNLFKRATDQYLPAGAPSGAYYITHDISATSGFEGSITQHLTNVPDGSYTFRCDLAGYPGNAPSTDGVYLVAFDKDNNEIAKYKCTLPSGSWTSAKGITNQIIVNVTGGECTVGVYVVAAGGATSTMTFKVLNFKFE